MRTNVGALCTVNRTLRAGLTVWPFGIHPALMCLVDIKGLGNLGGTNALPSGLGPQDIMMLLQWSQQSGGPTDPQQFLQQLGVNQDMFAGGGTKIDSEAMSLGRDRGVYTPGPALGAGPIHIGHRGQGVKDLQKMLNAMGANLEEDGLMGPKTEAALKSLQSASGLQPSGILDAKTLMAMQRNPKAQLTPQQWGRFKPQYAPGSNPDNPKTNRTLEAAFSKVPPEMQAGDVTSDQLKQIVPGLSNERATKIAPYLNQAMRDAGINTKRQKASFIAQLAHESGGFKYFEELASGRAYEGRRDLGNTQRGDGQRFKGRGPIQLTGRANYRAAGKALGIDLENNPQLASKLDVGFKTAAWFWNSKGLNERADRGDFRGVTKRINGGYNGYASRVGYLNRALAAIR